MTATSCGDGIIYKYIYNYFCLSHSNIGIYYICNVHSSTWQTLWRQAFSSKSVCLSAQNKTFQVCPYFFFWAVSRRYGASSSTSPTFLYRFELHLGRLFQVYQQGFFLSTGLFRKIWVLSLPEFQVVLSVLNSGYWTHETLLVYNHCQMHSIQTIKFKRP